MLVYLNGRERMKIEHGLVIIHKSDFTNPLKLDKVEYLCWFDEEPDWNYDNLVIEVLKGDPKLKHGISEYHLIRANAEILEILNEINGIKE